MKHWIYVIVFATFLCGCSEADYHHDTPEKTYTCQPLMHDELTNIQVKLNGAATYVYVDAIEASMCGGNTIYPLGNSLAADTTTVTGPPDAFACSDSLSGKAHQVNTRVPITYTLTNDDRIYQNIDHTAAMFRFKIYAVDRNCNTLDLQEEELWIELRKTDSTELCNLTFTGDNTYTYTPGVNSCSQEF
jgi:hypothetical protein